MSTATAVPDPAASPDLAAVLRELLPALSATISKSITEGLAVSLQPVLAKHADVLSAVVAKASPADEEAVLDDPAVGVDLYVTDEKKSAFLPTDAHRYQFVSGQADNTFRLLAYEQEPAVQNISERKPNGAYAMPAQREETLAFMSMAFYMEPAVDVLDQITDQLSSELAEAEADAGGAGLDTGSRPEMYDALARAANSLRAVYKFVEERAAFLRLKASYHNRADDTFRVPDAHRLLLQNARASPALGAPSLDLALRKQQRKTDVALGKIIAKATAEELVAVQAERPVRASPSAYGHSSSSSNSRKPPQRPAQKGGRGGRDGAAPLS